MKITFQWSYNMGDNCASQSENRIQVLYTFIDSHSCCSRKKVMQEYLKLTHPHFLSPLHTHTHTSSCNAHAHKQTATRRDRAPQFQRSSWKALRLLTRLAPNPLAMSGSNFPRRLAWKYALCKYGSKIVGPRIKEWGKMMTFKPRLLPLMRAPIRAIAQLIAVYPTRVSRWMGTNAIPIRPRCKLKVCESSHSLGSVSLSECHYAMN